MKRKLLFGATLACALLSIYAGMFGWTAVQYVFMAACLVLAVAALATPEDDETPRRPPGDR
jgi:sugar phosphate permease